MKDCPAYYVSYPSVYLGLGVTYYRREYFRTEEEQQAYVNELKKRFDGGIETGVIENFYHDNEKGEQE